MSGSRTPATAAAALSLLIIALMIPLVPAGAAPQKENREADMEFLEYLGTFEADGKEALDPLALEQLETEKKRTEKPAGKRKWLRPKEKTSEKDAGNE